MLTTEKQEEFFMSKVEDDDSTTQNNGAIHYEKFQSFEDKKQMVKIDGINYQFKHLIRN